MDKDIILQVKNLVTVFHTENGTARAVDDISFELKKGSTLGIVGESGCGKSVTSLSIMRLLPKPFGQIEKGEIRFKDTDILKLAPEKIHEIRGNRISMIFQEPMTALNPVHKIEKQIGEVFKYHFTQMNKTEISQKSLSLLQKVGIPDPEKCLKNYPHQISGGMRQRVMIAMALACEPDVLIADEPTTALDVTIQAQILKLMKDVQKEIGMSIIFITHDLGVIAEMCDDVIVMYAGEIAETASVKNLFRTPKHPYTKGLLSSIPRIDNKRKMKLNIIKGMVPSLFDMPDGCKFQNRCPEKIELCERKKPHSIETGKDHHAACHLLNKSHGEKN